MARSKLDVEFETERPIQQRAWHASYFRTGSTLLDLMVGGGLELGYAAGTIIQIVGESSGGKTFLACELIAAAKRQHKDRFHWVYDDVEHGFSFDGKALWGVDIIPRDRSQAVCSRTVAELFTNVRAFIKSVPKDHVGIYVVDSLDALCNDDIMAEARERDAAAAKGETYDKGSYGMATQRFLSQVFFKTLAAELDDSNILLVFLSQLRDNVNAGLFGDKRRVSGGSAVRFYCNTVLRLYNKETFEKNGAPVGIAVEAYLDKAKHPRPFRTCVLNFLFDYGLDDISTNIDYLYGLKSPQTQKLLPAACASINIGDTSDPRFSQYQMNADGLKGVLVDNGLYDEMREGLKAIGQKVTVGGMKSWLCENHPDIFGAYYGFPVTRDELIAKAEADREFRRSLQLRATEKWNKAEEDRLSGRHKYMEDEDDGY